MRSDRLWEGRGWGGEWGEWAVVLVAGDEHISFTSQNIDGRSLDLAIFRLSEARIAGRTKLVSSNHVGHPEHVNREATIF